MPVDHSSTSPRVAIIGSGISGLGAAWFLHRDFDVTVFESDGHAGGHTRTVDVEEVGRSVPVDTGFMVFNHVTYPNLTRLFRTLGVATKPTDMSFSVQHRPRDLEFCGSSWNHLFAQRRNLLRPSFYRMLLAVDRFNRDAVTALDDPSVARQTLDEFVRQRGYGEDFQYNYLLPMSSAVWCTPAAEMLKFPAATLLRFFHNHGFLGLHTQHPWWTVTGGARSYVKRLTAGFRHQVRLRQPVRRVRRLAQRGVEVATDTTCERFDKVVLACHPPQSLDLLGADASRRERAVLEAFRYHPNTATLHTDSAVMPRTRLAWSSWNYRLDAAVAPAADVTPAPLATTRTSTHYWMNRLQGVSDRAQYFVSIDGAHLVQKSRVIEQIAFDHPLFDRAAVARQAEIPALNAAAVGGTETYFVGAWQRYGFHEDGLLSAVNLAALLLNRDPWRSSP